MASESQPIPNDSWDRVSSELRAYREAQQQAWGEVDNATLGRFIADDLNGDERRQIEQALQEHPELQKLADLVRDVLADFEPAVERAPAQLPVHAPRILPFPKKQPSRPSVVRWVKQRGGMLAAACLLVVMSGALLDSRVGGALFGDSATPTAGPDRSTAVAMVSSGKQVSGFRGDNPPSSAGLKRLEILNNKMDNLEQAGQFKEALALDQKSQTVARKANLEDHLTYAANRERVAVLSEKQGDLDNATQCLSEAYTIKKKQLGQENKETAKTAQSLANFYAVAINSEHNNAPNGFAPMATPGVGHPLVMAPRATDASKDTEHKKVVELRTRLLRAEPAVLQQEIVPVMVQGLENAATEKEREQVIQALGNLGPNAVAALPALKARLQQSLDAEVILKGVPAAAPREDGGTDRERRVLRWAVGQIDRPLAANRDSITVAVSIAVSLAGN